MSDEGKVTARIVTGAGLWEQLRSGQREKERISLTLYLLRWAKKNAGPMGGWERRRAIKLIDDLRALYQKQLRRKKR